MGIKFTFQDLVVSENMTSEELHSHPLVVKYKRILELEDGILSMENRYKENQVIIDGLTLSIENHRGLHN